MNFLFPGLLEPHFSSGLYHVMKAFAVFSLYVERPFRILTYYRLPLSDHANYRIPAHRFPVEAGRYANIEHKERLCSICNSDDIGDDLTNIIIS